VNNSLTTFEIHADIQGRKLYGWLAGCGTPLVILDAGMGDASDTWSNVQPEVARFTRVLSYDRAGMGRSDPAPTPRACQDMTADLRILLAATSLPPPYVLVAHSWSGLNARWFANQHPEEVAGMLLIDAVHEGKYEHFAQVLPADRAERMWASIKDPTKNDECIDRMASIAQVTGNQRIYDFPLVILTRAADGDALSQIEIDLQGEFLKLSTNSRQLSSTFSDHYIQASQPDLVIEVIRQVVQSYRDTLR
jgi:pimeloyl-ACP methyl ester carboxylesterase